MLVISPHASTQSLSLSDLHPLNEHVQQQVLVIMESNTLSPSLVNAEAKATFKKPSNDTGTRHYRRRSPINGSSSSGDSPLHSREDSRSDTGSTRRKDGERNLEREYGRNHHGRGGDTYKPSDQQSSRSSYNNYNKRDKYIDEERHYSKSSLSGRENEEFKSRHHSHHDKNSRDRNDERRENRRGDNKYSCSPVHGSKSLRDKAEYRSKNISKELDNQKTSKQMDRSERHPREQLTEKSVFTGENEDFPAKKRKPVTLGSDYQKDADEGKSSKQAAASGCTAADIDAARITALKAAESVNKSLMGTGYMSADQKKKLLWGNKKSTPAEEQSSHRWDTATFSDREQQEKFNKLMGMKVEVKADQKPNNQEGNTEKHKEVLQDLEKQYVAGLRRRDGRTVGLGL